MFVQAEVSSEVQIVLNHAWNDLLKIVQIEQLKCQKVTNLSKREDWTASSLVWSGISLRCRIGTCWLLRPLASRELHVWHVEISHHWISWNLLWSLTLSSCLWLTTLCCLLGLHHSLHLNYLLVLVDSLLLHIDDLLIVNILLFWSHLRTWIHHAHEWSSTLHTHHLGIH